MQDRFGRFLKSVPENRLIEEVPQARRAAGSAYARRMELLHFIVRLGLAVLLAGLATLPPARAQTIFADGTEHAPLPGGSNYLWFGDDGACEANSRDAYGLVARYHETLVGQGTVRAIAQRQLATMRGRGMRRLSLGIYFMHHPAAGGTLVDSANAAHVAQAVANIAALLADVRAAGYREILFRFFPTDNINPSQPAFPAYGSNGYAARVEEYWNLVRQVRPVLASSGLAYRIDLGVELAPRDANPAWIPERDRYKYPANETWSRTVRTLWQRYTADYGGEDTVGFSFFVDDDQNRARSRVRHMRYVYEGRYPPVFAFDLYAGETYDEGGKFRLMDGFMTSQNPSGANWNTAGWILSEAYYEDPLAAEAIAAAMADTGRTVLYLTQWPLDRAGTCETLHVNVAPPFDWQAYPAAGLSVPNVADPPLRARCGARCAP